MWVLYGCWFLCVHVYVYMFWKIRKEKKCSVLESPLILPAVYEYAYIRYGMYACLSVCMWMCIMLILKYTFWCQQTKYFSRPEPMYALGKWMWFLHGSLQLKWIIICELKRAQILYVCNKMLLYLNWDAVEVGEESKNKDWIFLSVRSKWIRVLCVRIPCH